MKANPGGHIDSKSVIGRDPLIQIIWEALESQSLVITAERRIGKTTVLKKMEREPKPGWQPVYQDLERCHSPMEFAREVYGEIYRFLSKQGQVVRRGKEFLKKMGGTEIGGVFKLPETTTATWKDVLTHAIEDLMDEYSQNQRTKLLFLWDEMPYMLINIRNAEGEKTAMQVLDYLRWLRQTHNNLRMVITGSIGLHHVITSLKDKNYGNAPVNDMNAVEIPPLNENDAIHLADLLLAGEGLKLPNQRAPETVAAAAAIAHEADYFPFYVHNIVRGLRVGELSATPENVAKVVATHLVDSGDPWQLRHYRERISTYYPSDQRTVLLVLDHLAVEKETCSVNELLDMLKRVIPFDDREALLRILSLMERDHYLKREDSGAYRFRFPLIRRWWKLNRGL